MSNIVWIDLETGGLDPKTEQILEVAAIITDSELREVARFHQLVAPAGLGRFFLVGAWARTAHEALLKECDRFGREEKDVAANLGRFLREHSYGQKYTLAGSSIHFDYYYLKERMPEVPVAHLMYRLLDLSTLRIARNLACGLHLEHGFPTAQERRHRAVDDIEDSLESMRKIWPALKQLEHMDDDA